ncbi:MAG: alkaline shock response membrane anchor protein AmaP [Candidatus Omnitrophica bacterium]|nr:alkaline shock response membrane anchor protein AmaP [Candidatus Omnitrophota bacterium]
MGFLTVLIYIILSLATGVILIGLSLEIITVDILTAYLTEVPTDFPLRSISALIGLLLILICLRYIQTSFRRSRKNKSITFNSSEGKVSITLVAIEDMLRKMLEAKTEVSRIRPKVLLKKKGIEVIARGVLTTEVNLVDFTKEMQEQIKEKVHNLLGEDKSVQVNLEIRKIALNKNDLMIEDKEPEVPFRNYE